MTRRDALRAIALAVGMAIATPVGAQRWINVNFGIPITASQAFGNFTSFMAGSIVAVSTAAFIYGAFQMVVSRGEGVDKAKTIMKNALIGLAVVLGSYGMLRTTLWLLSQ